jgi:hypothetical protein
MMDHYEELGIERSASMAEIRQAYRRLMQLLHPDHCGDEASRRLAELQAKRLNALLAVLTDPVERERYNRELSFDQPVPALPPPLRTQLAHAPRWSWPVAGGAVVLALISLMVSPQRGAPANESPPGPKSAQAPGPQNTPVSKKPSALATAYPVRALSPRLAIPEAAEAADWDADIPPIAAPRTPPQPPLEEPPESELPGRETARAWEAPALAGPALGSPPRPPPRSTLAGEWLFLPQPKARSDGLYPPEYIELRVTEGSGSVRGKYRARYRIPDRAISPTVAFEFQGRAGDGGARLPWSGPGGARGEVTLHLLTTGALEVTWVVSQMGSELGLISGTATLVRKMD